VASDSLVRRAKGAGSFGVVAGELARGGIEERNHVT
jgi:hypothetical protein